MTRTSKATTKKVFRVPKIACVFLCLNMIFFISMYWGLVGKTRLYHKDCAGLFSKQPTSGCYETDALATYEEDRKATGGVRWYFVRFKLVDGQEIITGPKGNNPPRYLNAATMNGMCRVRIWRGQIVEVRNNNLYFPTEDNPEIDLKFYRVMITLSSLFSLFLILLLFKEVKGLKELKAEANPVA